MGYWEYGEARVVYNLFDSSKSDQQYSGAVKMDCVMFGSILAPSSTVTVGAINGSVIGKNIIHSGGESHRNDVLKVSGISIQSSNNSGGTTATNSNGSGSTASKPGMNPGGVTSGTTASTQETSTTQVTDSEKAKGNLIVTVLDEKTGKPVSNASVVITSPNGNKKTYKTDKDGKITLSDVPIGKYKIKVAKVPDGYSVSTTKTFYATVSAGNTTKKKFSHKRATMKKRQWIYIPDTVIDYQVVYTPDDEQQYLHQDFNNNYNSHGTLFFSKESQWEGKYLLVYGHNMRDGTIFASLVKYKDKKYCEKHPFVTMYLQDATITYEVVKVFCITVDDSEKNTFFIGILQNFRIKKSLKTGIRK